MVPKRRFSPALLLVLIALAGSPAAAQGPVSRQDPLLVGARVFPRVVLLAPNTIGAFELQVVMQNISRNQSVTLHRVSGTVTFEGGLTEPFGLYDSALDPQGGLLLAPGAGFEIAALLLIPASAPMGAAVVRVTVEYDLEGSRSAAQVAVPFGVVRE